MQSHEVGHCGFLYVQEYLIHLLLPLSRAECKRSCHSFSVPVHIRVLDVDESFCPCGNAQSQPNLAHDGCISDRLIARLLLKAGEVLRPLQRLQAAVLAGSQLGTPTPSCFQLQ